jgi:hypothetical protein
MKSERIDRERAANILVDAFQLGDLKAAKKWGITDRTLRNYRARLASDASLSAIFRDKMAAADRSWHADRTRTLRILMSRMVALAQTETDLDKLSRAVKEVGGVDVAVSALNVGDSADSQVPEPSAPPGDDGEADAGPLPH